MAATMTSPAQIILYTNHRCPWAHRAHVALEALEVPFKEVIIDIDVPRSPEYLAVNPRGQVPSVSYQGESFTESGPISWLLADSLPGKLAPASNAPGGAQKRARIAFFADTFFSKFQDYLFKLHTVKTDEDMLPIARQAVDQLVKEVEPLLHNAGPFFGGSKTITLAEVLTGSFVVRLFSLTRAGVYPASLTSSIAERAPNFWNWAQHVASHPNVTCIYDEKVVVAATQQRIAQNRAILV